MVVAVVVASVARSALVGWLVFRGAAPYPALPGVVCLLFFTPRVLCGLVCAKGA